MARSRARTVARMKAFSSATSLPREKPKATQAGSNWCASHPHAHDTYAVSFQFRPPGFGIRICIRNVVTTLKKKAFYETRYSYRRIIKPPIKKIIIGSRSIPITDSSVQSDLKVHCEPKTEKKKKLSVSPPSNASELRSLRTLEVFLLQSIHLMILTSEGGLQK